MREEGRAEGEDVPAEAEGPEGADASEAKKYDWTNPTLQIIYRDWMHDWSKSGEHMGWRTAGQLDRKSVV